MVEFSLDVAAISAFTVIAVIVGSWWIYKSFMKLIATSGSNNTLRESPEVINVKDFQELENAISEREHGEFYPAAIHGKDLSVCWSKLLPEKSDSNELKKYLQEIIKLNPDFLANAMQYAMKNLVHTLETNGSKENALDIADELFTTVFKEMQFIFFGDLGDLQLEDTLKLTQKHLKSVIKLWPKYADEKERKTEKFFAGKEILEFEDSRENLLNCLIHIIKKKLDTVTKTSNEAYADYVLKCDMVEDKGDAVKFVAFHLLDLFVYGTEALFRSLESGIESLTDNIEIQESIFEEISKINGDRLTATDLLKNKSSLPLTRAVAREVLRLFTPVPLAIFHEIQKTEEDRDVQKNRIIATDLKSVMTDLKVWKNSDAFKPDRFLDPLKKDLIQKEEYIPFYFGDRSCPAEILAEVTMFIVFGIIVQMFQLKRSHKVKDDDLHREVVEEDKKDDSHLKLLVVSRNAPEKQLLLF